jgi:hypothetical protein
LNLLGFANIFVLNFISLHRFHHYLLTCCCLGNDVRSALRRIEFSLRPRQLKNEAKFIAALQETMEIAGVSPF